MRRESPVPQPDHERVFVPRQVGVEALDVTIDLRGGSSVSGRGFRRGVSRGCFCARQVSGGSERQADEQKWSLEREGMARRTAS